jgi:hypothetical protein
MPLLVRAEVQRCRGRRIRRRLVERHVFHGDQLFAGPAVGQFHHDVELADVARVLLKQVE